MAKGKKNLGDSLTVTGDNLTVTGASLVEESLGSSSANNSRLSTSGRKRSLYLSDVESDLEAVNVASEKKERRNAEAFEKAKEVSIQEATSKEKAPISVLNNLTAQEIDTHYFQCLNLYSQNKVNLKNAFKLQLINFMQMQVATKSEKSENLTLMSCTLDASAKIYSCRVDKVYTDMLKCLSGKDMTKEKKEKNDGKENDDNDNEAANGRDTPPLKKSVDDDSTENEEEDDYEALLKPSKFVRDPSSFRRKDIDPVSYSEVMPKNQEYFLSCPISGSGYLLALNKPLFEKHGPPLSSDKLVTNIGSINVSEPDNDHLEEYIPGYNELSSKFHIIQSETHNMNTLENSFTYDSEVHRVSTVHNEGNDSDGEANDRELLLLDYDEDEFQLAVETTTLGTSMVTPSRSISVPSKIESQNLSFDPSSLTRMLRSSKSEYSLFDNSKLQFMTGASHWKIKPIESDKKSITGKTPLKGIRRSQYLYFMSDQLKKDLEISFFEDDIKNLSKKTICDWNLRRSDNTLSKDIDYSHNKLIGLFKHNICFLIKSKEGYESQKQGLNESVALTQNEFFQNNDDDNRDDDFDEPVELDDLIQSSIEEPSLPCPSTTLDSAPPNQSLDQSLLAPSKMKVEKVSIKYAKKQKRIDIKRLKETMWNVISNNNSGKENVANMNQLNVNECEKGLKFSSVFKEVLPTLPEEMAEDLEMPTAFLTLLFLANEKNLVLKNEGPDIDIALE